MACNPSLSLVSPYHLGKVQNGQSFCWWLRRFDWVERQHPKNWRWWESSFCTSSVSTHEHNSSLSRFPCGEASSCFPSTNKSMSPHIATHWKCAKLSKRLLRSRTLFFFTFVLIRSYCAVLDITTPKAPWWWFVGCRELQKSFAFYFINVNIVRNFPLASSLSLLPKQR